MMARVAAEDHIPDGGKMVEFSLEDAPKVRIGDIHGVAVAYTEHHGLVEWTNSRGKYFFDWFPAGEIRRVQE